jgi:hypothetical protein
VNTDRELLVKAAELLFKLSNHRSSKNMEAATELRAEISEHLNQANADEAAKGEK